MYASGVQLGDLAAAHQTESNFKPPSALLCVPTTASTVEGALEVSALLLPTMVLSMPCESIFQGWKENLCHQLRSL